MQFRLLREDFLQPLRQGIAQYREFAWQTGGHLDAHVLRKLGRIESLHAYFGVRSVRTECSDHGIVCGCCSARWCV